MPAISWRVCQFWRRSSWERCSSTEGLPALSKCFSKRPSVRAKLMKSNVVPSGLLVQSSFVAGLPWSESRSESLVPRRGS